MEKKSQSAMEFMIIAGAMFFLFVSVLFVFQQNLSTEAEEKRRLEVQEIALTVQNEINLAISSTDGYYRSFTIPQKIINQDYTITASEGIIYIITEDNKHSIALPIPPVNGTIQKGANIIRKINSVIYLN